MATRIAPCKGCPDRTSGDRMTDCHTTCERYAAFREARLKEHKARKEYDLVRSTTLEGMRRMRSNPPPGPSRTH